MTDKDSVLTYKSYILPADHDILPSAEKSEKALSAVDHYCHHLSRFGIYLDIVGKAYPAAVRAVYYLLVPQLCKTTVIHGISPPAIYTAGGDRI